MTSTFEKLNPGETTPEIAPKAERAVYRARPERDRAITAIPEILWKSEEHKRERGEEPILPSTGHENGQEDFGTADAGNLDAKILELYAMAQEYALEPASLSAVRRSERISDIAEIKDAEDDAYLESLTAFFDRSEKTREDTEPQTEAQAKDAFTEALVAHKQYVRSAILELMADPVVRARYLAEITSERSARRAPETRRKLKEILQLRGLRNRLQAERRHLRVEEFLAHEEGAGKPRAKLSGRTPQALKNLERGIALAEAKESERTALLSSSSRGLLATESLLQRKRELEEKGFVLSPSRERLISEITEFAAQGYRIFLGGPTGTGKTSLALFALREMTDGNYAWVTWTGETSTRDLFGSPKLAVTEEGKVESGMTKGPVTKAVTGERSGVLHEEFTSGQTSIQMSMKTLWASRPGEQINLPGFNGTEFAKSELIELATGNLKGKRHQERESMDPAVAREFKALEVPFMPADETRDYLILPTLIDRTGIMPLNREEIEMITQFCRAAELSQLAYHDDIPQEMREGDLYKIISPSGEPIALTNVFLDTGTVKDLFSGWRTSGKPLAAYIQEGLRRFIEQNPHFKENKTERETLKNILRAYGFNLGAENTKDFFAVQHVHEKSAHSYYNPTELGFLIPGTPPSEEDEFGESEAEKQALIDKINAAQGEIPDWLSGEQGPSGAESILSTPEFVSAKLELQKSEQEAIKKYFGKAAMGIEVPPVPAEITREQFEFWKENKFRLHYSPGLEIKKDNEFPGQEKKLDNDIYKWMTEGKIAADSATLPKGWILIDERQKPGYDDGKQMYEDDILAPVLKDLRGKGLIADYKEPGSRFNISPDELNVPEVKDAIAKALKVRPEQLEAMKAVLFNYIGNKSHPEWGETNTWEWFQDKYGSSSRLRGGGSDFGGLSYANYGSSGYRGGDLGFRLSVRFSV